LPARRPFLPWFGLWDDRGLLLGSRERGAGFGEFYRRHRTAVLAFHGARVREPELADDLTAETFAAALLVVHDRSRELRERPVAWLFTIAHSKVVDSYRRGRVEAAACERLALERIEVARPWDALTSGAYLGRRERPAMSV